MGIFKTIISAGLLLVSACSSPPNKTGEAKTYSPGSNALYDTIARVDSLFFDAFNRRDFDDLKAFISENLEFYHDLGGVTDYTQNIAGFRKTFESDRRLRRQLVTPTLEVYPINNYGAVETGVHRFYVTENGQREKLSSEAKFVQVWQNKDGGWKVTRIISYGHQEYLK